MSEPYHTVTVNKDHETTKLLISKLVNVEIESRFEGVNIVAVAIGYLDFLELKVNHPSAFPSYNHTDHQMYGVKLLILDGPRGFVKMIDERSIVGADYNNTKKE